MESIPKSGAHQKNTFNNHRIPTVGQNANEGTKMVINLTIPSDNKNATSKTRIATLSVISSDNLSLNNVMTELNW
jgi:hypothetical protein